MRDSSVGRATLNSGGRGFESQALKNLFREKYTSYNERRVIMMNKDKSMKYVGLACTLIGFGLTMVQKQLDDKKLQEIVDETVQKKLNESNK